MAKKRGLSADEKKQKMLEAMLAGVFGSYMLLIYRKVFIT